MICATAAHAQDSALPGYLDQARRLLAAHPAPAEDGPAALPGLSDDFETLRWFVLPPECLTPDTPPGARTVARSARRAAGSVIVCGVSRGSGPRDR